MLDNKKHPGILIELVLLIDSHFHREHTVTNDTHVNIEFNYEKAVIEGKAQAILKTKVHGYSSEEKKVYEIQCSFIGIYSQDPKNINMTLEEFLEAPAVTHLYPYVREYISNLSIRAGIPVVYLPPTNINALLSQAEKIETKEETTPDNANTPK